MSSSLIDGQPGASVPIDDRGLLYGDHLFETIAFHQGQAPLWNRHWRRLVHGCGILGMAPPSEQIALTECQSVAGSSDSRVVRITLTRGSGGKAYWPDPDQPVRRIVQARRWPDGLAAARKDGLNLVTSRVRLASGSVLSGLKHGNRLEQVLAARDCAEQGGDEALLYDNLDRLVEAIASNLLLVIDQQCVTPLADSGVAGVGLEWLMDQAETDIVATAISHPDAARASAVMVINSVTGIRPGRSLDGRPLDIGEPCRFMQQLWTRRLNSPCDS